MAVLTIEQELELARQHHQAGRLREAELSYRQILEHRGSERADTLRIVATMINLGALLIQRGELDQAIICYREALKLDPNSHIAHANLGSALQYCGRPDEAMAAYQSAIALQPGFSGGYGNLGTALRETGRLDEAIAAFRRTLALDPGNSAIASFLLYCLHFHPTWNARAIASEHAAWNRRYAEPLKICIQPHSNDRHPARRLRIGYVSPDFRNHVVGRNLLPLFQKHHREKFDIYCYSNVHRPDSMTQQFQQLARWCDIAHLTDTEAGQQIRQDGIDILVDLTLHMADNRLLLFARKPAPVQATFAGYPGSTGLNAIDYRLSDPYIDPPEIDDSIYSEKTIRLGDSFWCYDPLEERDIAVNPLPALSDPDRTVTFGCLNNFCKINDQVLVLWAQVLRRVEASRLLLLSPEGSHRLRVLERLSHNGVTPDRVEFVPLQPRRAYLELYHRIDVGLDTFPYNGHTTTLDSLWMGVPVVTLVGQTAVARAGWSQLSNLGLTELAAQTPEQFVDIAVDLAMDLPRLAELRDSLRPRMERCPLMDAQKFARNVEAAYRQIWRNWCENEPGKVVPELAIEQTLDLAKQHHQAGRLQEAERLYRRILAHNPRHADALYHLGILSHQAGRNDIAAELLRQSIAHGIETAEAHNNLGVIRKLGGRGEDAIASYRRAIHLRPDYAEALNNLGSALAETGQPNEAIVALRQAIAIQPLFPEAMNNLSVALKDIRRFDEAIAACKRAIELRPDFAEAFNNLAINLKENGGLEAAISACRSAIALRPNFAEAWNTLGAVHKGLAQFDDAIAACRSATAIRPEFAAAFNNLGMALQGKGLLDEALTAYRRAIALAPASAAAHNNLGTALQEKGKASEAIAAYRHAIAADPAYQAAQSNLLFALHLDPAYPPSEIRAEHDKWNQIHAHPLAKLIQAHLNHPDPQRRLKVGYVSPDFCRRIIGLNLLPFFRHHDHEEFEITCYAQVVRSDAITREFEQNSDRWRNIVRITDEQLAEQIREDRIDILIDLTMHNADNRLLAFARKPAPVQVTYLSYAGSTGLSAMDYRLSDPYLDPRDGNLSEYAEKTIHLPRTYWCYQPAGDTPAVSQPPMHANGHVTFGCLNNFAKVSPAALELWRNILATIPNSRLILHAPPGDHRTEIAERFGESGVESSRVSFIGKQLWAQYASSYSQIDIALDPFPYGGGITTCDALWMGVPVVSLSGNTAVGRGGRSILTNLGLPELVASTPDQYLQIAVDLAGDGDRMAQLRKTMRDRMLASPLLDAPAFARDIESAYRRMWQDWCEKQTG